ncbi:hypothetical protein Ddye_008596 [Dipteronia dyeriana]|uniref:J domain-containing protein n=1 Tax=Dipteronia dyeriana TaxID=168575 RepID=A0AAD9XA02_9ROSI|nr:hypothetical protein Ddye_008596 [Dipteronia dyeriana]
MSKMKAYSVPLVLFVLALFYQLLLLPRSFPPSHYDVLGIKRYTSIEQVKSAYDELYSKWNSGEEVPSTIHFLKIRYAYELLSHPLWKRNYDIYGFEEQLHVLYKVREQYGGESFSNIDLPLLDDAAIAFDHSDHAFKAITSENFRSMLNDSKPLLIQVYTDGSYRCAQFSNVWRRIVALLEGIANSGAVELNEIDLATYFAERKPTGQYFFRNGLPSLVAFPSWCKASHCMIRFEGELSVDSVTDWFATTILGLPRIFYHTKESLGKSFLAKSGPHKVKIICFSKTGERATPFLRQISKDYWAYASFAFVLWQEEESSFWWNTFEVDSAPAIVFIKDPGVKPTVYYGSFNNSWVSEIIERNKQQELPQLRSLTSLELGCDARGYSRSGNDIRIWYCVILAGRQSSELRRMRETMRRVQELLSSESDLDALDVDRSLTESAIAFQNKRLTFAWLDGEAQERYCSFYLYCETAFETCGPRRDLSDVPRLFVVRYKRNATAENIKVVGKPKNIWDVWQYEEVDPASQLVVRYNGSTEIPEIIKWISEIIKDGDFNDLPFYRVKTPDLVPEESEPIWSRGAQSIRSKSIGVKDRIHNIMGKSYDYLEDPRIGPALLLASLMSFGTIWLVRNQPGRPRQSGQQSQSSTEDESRPKQREHPRNLSKKIRPPITDVEPKDAYQMPLSDSETD